MPVDWERLKDAMNEYRFVQEKYQPEVREPYCPTCGCGTNYSINKTCEECLSKGLGSEDELHERKHKSNNKH